MVLLGVGGAVALATVLSRPIFAAGCGDEEHRGGQLQHRPARYLAGRAGRPHALLQRHGPGPPGEGDDQAGLHPLRGAGSRRRDPQESRAAGPHRRAPGGHRALLRHPRVHAPVRAPGSRGRGPAPERFLQPHDRDDLQARRHPGQVPGRRRDVRLRRAHRAGRPRHAGDTDRARHAGRHRGAQRALRRSRAGRPSPSGSG